MFNSFKKSIPKYITASANFQTLIFHECLGNRFVRMIYWMVVGNSISRDKLVPFICSRITPQNQGIKIYCFSLIWHLIKLVESNRRIYSLKCFIHQEAEAPFLWQLSRKHTRPGLGIIRPISYFQGESTKLIYLEGIF